MTATQSRELRRARKLRAVRLLSAQARAERESSGAASLEQARRAWREWDGRVPVRVRSGLR